MKASVSLPADAEHADLIIRIDRHPHLLGENGSGPREAACFLVAESTGSPAITSGTARVPQTRKN